MRNGSASYQGRLEVKYNGEWGTVCNKAFSHNELSVACRELGFINSVGISSAFSNGPSGGVIWLENVHCTGNEISIFDCSIDKWGNTSCTHDNDVGIVCLRKCKE